MDDENAQHRPSVIYMFDILFQQSANYAVIKNQSISFISPFNEHNIMVIAIFGQSIIN